MASWRRATHLLRMALNIRTYHDLTEPDRSALVEQIGAQRRRVADRMAAVRRVLAVLSGKGGVGKSYVTAQLARALGRSGRLVGVLDADLNGPTIPRLLDAPGGAGGAGGGGGAPRPAHADAVEPAAGAEGVKCMSMALLMQEGMPLAFRGPESESFVWRGALEAGVLREFLADVAWGALDFLLVDLPPGVQRFTELTELLPAPPAVVENMVGGPFAGSAADDLAAEFGVPVLARIPFHPRADMWDRIAQCIGGAA